MITRRERLATTMITLLIVVALGIAITYAVRDDGSSGKPGAAGPSTSAGPIASASPSAPGFPVATPSPTPSLTAEPTPGPSLTGAPRPTGAGTPTERPTWKPKDRRSWPFPTPTTSYSSLTVTAEWVDDPQDTTTGTALTLRVHVRDGDGKADVFRVEWGDGSVWQAPGQTALCPVHPSPTADPGPYRPEPTDLVRDFPKSYDTAGDYTVTVTTNSPGPGCGRGYGAKFEQVKTILTITITDP